MKKLLSLVLVTFLVLSVFTVGAFATESNDTPVDYVPVDAADTTRYQAASKWNGTVYNLTTIENKYSFEGEGTEASPYLINSADDLAKLAANVRFTSTDTNYAGKYFKLTVDIDMQHNAWMGIGGCFNGVRWGAASGDASARDFEMFQGVFDGDNHVIYNFNLADKNANNEAICANGLFGYAGKGAEIYNIGIANGDATLTNASRIGALIGASRFDLVVENCFNRANLTFVYEADFTYAGPGGAMEARVGGLMGAVMNDASTERRIENCYNSGNITVTLPEDYKTYCVAGIVGYLSDGVDNLFINCANTGTITVNANHGDVGAGNKFGATVAPLVGSLAWGDSFYTFEDCKAGGAVVYTNANSAAANMCIGSFLAYCRVFNDVEFDGDNVYSVVLTPDEPVASNPGFGQAKVTKVDSITLTYSDNYFMAVSTSGGDETPDGDGTTDDNTGDTTDTSNNGNEDEETTTKKPDTTTAPKADDTTTAAPAEEKKGCGSVVSIGALSILLLAGGAALSMKKKED